MGYKIYLEHIFRDIRFCVFRESRDKLFSGATEQAGFVRIKCMEKGAYGFTRPLFYEMVVFGVALIIEYLRSTNIIKIYS